MITLDQLKENYIMPLLNSTPFKFMIFTDAGNYRPPDRRKNTVTEYINGLFSLSQSEVQRLGGGLTAVALVTNIKILIPCGDNSDTSYTGELRIVQQSKRNSKPLFHTKRKLTCPLFLLCLLLRHCGRSDQSCRTAASSFPVHASRRVRFLCCGNRSKRIEFCNRME